jgi:hypothetical protein
MPHLLAIATAIAFTIAWVCLVLSVLKHPH